MNNKPILLAVDDEPAILHAFRRAFAQSDLELVTVGSAQDAIQRVHERRPDVIILDVNLPDMNGLEAFQRIHAIDARIPIIFITGHGTTNTAIEAIKMGAFDYLFKPLELAQLRELINRALRISHVMLAPTLLADLPSDSDGDAIIGRSPAMQEVYKAIGQVAPQDVTVLLLGESGTGKELVARAIYQHSSRARAPFLPINCAAIPESLLESELFGHERGAFTGADRLRIGKFEQCNGGTLFLDEIGDMTPLTQSKLLRVLQEQQFERLGGSETIRTDARIIAATNRNLDELRARGDFRTDLYFRLSVFTIRLPPLRERSDDLPLLVDYFVRRFNRELGRAVLEVAPETMGILRAYPWPGNVRELQSVVKQALLNAHGNVLIPHFLPEAVRTCGEHPEKSPLDGSNWDQFIADELQAGTENLYEKWQAMTDRHLIQRVLQHTRGNQLQAARILGITRGTLRARLRSLQLNIEELQE